METLGERVKARRKRLGMTQQALAEQSKISRSMIALIETGRRGESLGAGLLHRLATALNVLPSWLWTGRGPSTPSALRARSKLRGNMGRNKGGADAPR